MSLLSTLNWGALYDFVININKLYAILNLTGNMNLKENIEERLWNYIKRNYIAENYSNAILDSIQFLGDLIRDKSGLEGDGNSLIGIAFGGENPKLKLNALQTESEKNFQKGIEQILRGIYSAYRNPRSHSKHEDLEQDANEIIYFINHLIKILDKSKGKFSTEIFLNRVFDKDFVQDKKYGEILVKSVPATKYYEVAVELYKNKSEGSIINLQYVWESLFLKLNEVQRKEILDLVSEELRFTNHPEIVSKCIGLFSELWEQIDEDARLRAENKIINLISKAEKDVYGKVTTEGANVTWLTSIIEKMSLKEELAGAIEDLFLTRVESKQRFVLEYFGRHLKSLEQHLFLTSFDEMFIDELTNGNDFIYTYISGKSRANPKENSKFKKHLENFKSNKTISDDLPF